jgi:hypothetical protein
MVIRPPNAGSGWYPADPNFREEFHSNLAAAIRRVAEHRDSTSITTLVNRIPDDQIRRSVLRQLTKLLPLDYHKETQSLRRRKDAPPFDWEAPVKVTVFDAKMLLDSGVIRIGGTNMTPEEFAEEAHDILILCRHRLSPTTVSRLQATLTAIAESQRKRTDR